MRSLGVILPFVVVLVPFPARAALGASRVPSVTARMIGLCHGFSFVVHVLADLIRGFLDGLHVRLVLRYQLCHPCAHRRRVQREKAEIGSVIRKFRL